MDFYEHVLSGCPFFLPRCNRRYTTNMVCKSETSLIRTTEIRAPPSTGQPSTAILLIKSSELGMVKSLGVTCYSIS